MAHTTKSLVDKKPAVDIPNEKEIKKTTADPPPKVDKEKPLRQINNFKGKRCTLELQNGDVLEGTLVFFNFKDQVVHINNYVIWHKEKSKDGESVGQEEKGAMIVINGADWAKLKIKE